MIPGHLKWLFAQTRHGVYWVRAERTATIFGVDGEPLGDREMLAHSVMARQADIFNDLSDWSHA